MSGGKTVAICQFGGEFVTGDDGNMSYSGGEAHVVVVDRDLPFDDFIVEVSNILKVDVGAVSFKYFLPGNRRIPITVSGDKDLQRMVDFHADSRTIDVYVQKVDNRATRCDVADLGTSVVATAAVAKKNGMKQKRLATKPTNKRRNTNAGAASGIPAAQMASSARNVRQRRPSSTDNVINRVIRRAEATASSAAPVSVHTVRRERFGLVLSDVDNRETSNVGNVAGAHFVAPVTAFDDSMQLMPNVVAVDDAREIRSFEANVGSSIFDHFGMDGSDRQLDLSNLWGNLITGVGQEFDNANGFRDALSKYAIARGFAYSFIKNESNRVTQDRDKMVDDLERAAQVCTVEEFNVQVENIRGISIDAADWVLSSGPENWSNALFRGLRYGHLSSDLPKSLNSWIPLKHESSIIQIVEAIRCKMMEVITTRQELSKSWEGTLVPSIEKELQKEMTKARSLSALCSSGSVFEVRGNSVDAVNIETWECTCRKWQVYSLPCMHAIAVFNRIKKPVHNYCFKYFTIDCYRSTYSGSIYPILGEGEFLDINSICGASSYPPPAIPVPGRRRRIRLDRMKPNRKTFHCSRCKGVGHNKATCYVVV
ncbi:hypothetical protein QJS10_CPB22g00085 [Acorus calamus]|uniref:SWIM-type domain-containing protein n=1 Tax=Acorus calamus TaxID=4465 RepID=A0AAV9BZY6_ACOCL|nr:hypothetical protein QJS10_CPB22g00085 [Acorus calamus]